VVAISTVMVHNIYESHVTAHICAWK